MFELKAFVNILFRPKTKYMPNFNLLFWKESGLVMSKFLMMMKGQHKPELLSLKKTILCSISHEKATITMPSLQFPTIREVGAFLSVIEIIIFTIKKYIVAAVNHAICH